MTPLATRHRPLFPLLLVSAFLLLFTASASAQNPAWDHYKVYRPRVSPTANQTVVLRDQFSSDTILVKNLGLFANPVEKKLSNGLSYPYSDPHLHYAWWDLDPRAVNRTVRVVNQFGPQDLTLSRLRYLLNPALKDESGHPPLKNHYKCYECTGPEVGVRNVSLIDQFGPQTGVNVRRPQFFCNPTEKILGLAAFPIVDPAQHYVCYDIQPVDPRIFSVRFTDQFYSDFPIELSDGSYLCVPTDKVDPTPIRRESWGRLKMLYR
jgi:hypothetical protein